MIIFIALKKSVHLHWYIYYGVLIQKFMISLLKIKIKIWHTQKLEPGSATANRSWLSRRRLLNVEHWLIGLDAHDQEPDLKTQIWNLYNKRVRVTYIRLMHFFFSKYTQKESSGGNSGSDCSPSGDSVSFSTCRLTFLKLLKRLGSTSLQI